jgi:hypothetical protein
VSQPDLPEGVQLVGPDKPTTDKPTTRVELSADELGFLQYAVRMARRKDARNADNGLERWGDEYLMSEALTARIRIGETVNDRLNNAKKALEL